MDAVLDRVAREGDLAAVALAGGQSLSAALRSLGLSGPSVVEAAGLAESRTARRCRGGRRARPSSRRDHADLPARTAAARTGGTSRATNQPGNPRSRTPSTIGDPLVPPERRHLAEHRGSRTAAARRGGSSPAGGPAAGRAGRSGDRTAPGVRAFGTAAQSPSAQTSVTALDAERRVDDDAAAVVERQPERRDERARLHPGGPDERPRRDPRAVREHGDRAVERGERRPTCGSRPRVARARRARTRRAVAGCRRGSSVPRRRAPSAAARPGARGTKCRTASWARSRSSASASTPA